MDGFDIKIYGWCVVGVALSVLLPVAWQAVNVYFPKTTDISSKAIPPSIIKFLMPYLVLGLTSALTALLLVAFVGDTLKDFRAALLAGYAWDSTLQKFRK